MGETDAFRNYVRDLGYLLRDMALDAKREEEAARKESTDEVRTAFLTGQSMAFYNVIALMQDQARAFQIPLTELSLESVVPDRDLL